MEEEQDINNVEDGDPRVRNVSESVNDEAAELRNVSEFVNENMLMKK